MAVDVAAIGPFFCIGLAWIERRHRNIEAGEMGRRLATWCMILLGVGIGLGLVMAAILWLNGDDRFFAGLQRIPQRRLGFGVAELVFYLLCMLAYRGLWRAPRCPAWLHSLFGLAAGTNLLYHFPVLFTVIRLAGSGRSLPQTASGHVDVVHAMLLPESLARLAHHVAAAVVVSGVFVLWLTNRPPRRAADGKSSRRLGAWAARIALAAALLQVPLGGYLLMQIPTAIRNELLGRDLAATALLAVGVVAAIGLMHHLATAAWGEATTREIARSTLLVALVMLMMVAAERRARQVAEPPVHRLASQADPHSSLAVVTDFVLQESPLHGN